MTGAVNKATVEPVSSDRPMTCAVNKEPVVPKSLSELEADLDSLLGL